MRESNREWMRRAALVSAVAALLLAGSPVLAQVSTATIEVEIIDNSNAALPGATVKVANAATGMQRVAVTDMAGSAVFKALPVGTYEVTANLDSFAPVTQQVVLRIGQTQRLRIGMRVQLSETITVTAETPMVDVYRSDTSTNIVPEQIQQLPTADRDFQNLAFIAPGVQRERGGYRFIGDAPLVGSSGNASETAIIVDGVDLTDQALGLSRARFSQDAIGEFRVINNRFDAEIGSSAGGVLSVITKSGSNELHGSGFAFYRGDSLRSQGALEEGTQDFTRYQLGFTFGGPIVQDQTHYFFSVEYIDEDNITLFRPLGTFADLAEDIPIPFQQLLGLVSIDHQIGDAQNLQFRFVFEDFQLDNFRVGGVNDQSSGMALNRRNWNLMGGHTWMVNDNQLNELRTQYGRKFFEEPNNSDQLAEWFSFGNTLVTGSNIIGDQDMTGNYIGIKDTFNWHVAAGRSTHDIKLGGSFDWISEKWHYPLLPQDWMFYLDDTRFTPFRYDYFTGSPDLEVDTTIMGIFVQDDWRVRPDLTISLGLRYDYDSDGANPDFQNSGHELVGSRSADSDNFQPRLGFTWDVGATGENVVRGGAGLFTGRYLLIPAFMEEQQNGLTGAWMTRLNGAFLGLPEFYWFDPADPYNTGLPLAPNITLLEDNLEAPETLQVSLGYTRRLGNSGLYLGVDGVYSEGDNEFIIRDTNWRGNDFPAWLLPQYSQINMYTNQGHSEYKAIIASLNGTLSGGHLIACNLTYGDKKNLSDDFSPVLTNYPSDPGNIEAEWGRARSDEELRVVLSGVFKLPANFTLAPIFQYGSGQPWNRRLGYDFNGDGRFSDRAEGVSRNSEDGPSFTVFNLRLTWSMAVGNGDMDFIIEGFNIFNKTNHDVNSINNAEYLSGPTVLNPDPEYVANPNFGTYSATLAPREIQLGLRYRF